MRKLRGIKRQCENKGPWNGFRRRRGFRVLLASPVTLGYDQVKIALALTSVEGWVMRRPRWFAFLLCLPLVVAAGIRADEQDKKPKAEPSRYETRKEHDQHGIGKFYMGREIAQVMGHAGIDWLERSEREKEEAPSKLHEILKVKAGEVVADIGAGSGYHTFRLADKVGAKGKVYAVDIQPEMLDVIKKRMKEKKLENIVTVQGTETDPKLPENAVDMILLVDVYHEFSYPWEMTKAMVKALKPGGRLVFVEFRMEDEKVPILLVHKMTQKQVIKEMEPHPLKWLKTDDGLPWQHIIFFEKKKAKE
jgi:protein-L-isoaspartate O-methyltransferase